MSYDVAHTETEEKKKYTAENFENTETKSICMCTLCITMWWIPSVEDRGGEKRLYYIFLEIAVGPMYYRKLIEKFISSGIFEKEE